MYTILNLNLKAEIKITSFLNDPLLHGRPQKCLKGQHFLTFSEGGKDPKEHPNTFLRGTQAPKRPQKCKL